MKDMHNEVIVWVSITISLHQGSILTLYLITLVMDKFTRTIRSEVLGAF